MVRLGKAISINPGYAKAYYRRGLSYLSILRPTDAVPDFKKALNIEPNNKAAREQLTATVKLIRRIEFEKVCTLHILHSSIPLILDTNIPPVMMYRSLADLLLGNLSR